MVNSGKWQRDGHFYKCSYTEFLLTQTVTQNMVFTFLGEINEMTATLVLVFKEFYPSPSIEMNKYH